MSKSTVPVRLNAELLAKAATDGQRFHRSAASQISYWAELGQRVAGVLDPDVLDQVIAGIKRLQVEPASHARIDAGEIFAAMEEQRRSGRLQERVTQSPLRYQASHQHPAYLEQLDASGHITIGRFKAGKFVPMDHEPQ